MGWFSPTGDFVTCKPFQLVYYLRVRPGACPRGRGSFSFSNQTNTFVNDDSRVRVPLRSSQTIVILTTLEVSFMLLESIYSTSTSQDDHHLRLLYFLVQTTNQAWARFGFWLIQFCSNEQKRIFLNPAPSQSHPVLSKNNIPIHWTKNTVRWLEQTGGEQKLYILFNLINLVKSHLYWWNINKPHSKTKEQTHEIQLNFCEIQVLTRSYEI